jgi:hypothetical protein
VWGAGFAAPWAIQVRLGVAAVDNQVADVRNPVKRVGKDINRIADVKQAVSKNQ